MVIYDQVLSERLLQFNDVCRCQLVIADDVGFAKALNRVLFGNINGVEDKITWYSNRYSAIFECR